MPSSRRGIGDAWQLVVAGPLIAFVGCLLPWVSLLLIGNLDLFNLLSFGGGGSDFWPIMILGSCAALVLMGIGLRDGHNPGLATTALCIAILGAALTGIWGIGLDADVRGAAGFASVGVGPFVTVGGYIVAAVGTGVTASCT